MMKVTKMNHNFKIIDPIIWRELKRQQNIKIIFIFQTILTIVVLYTKFSNLNLFYYFTYVPISFTFVTQNDIFFYDLTTYIETLLSTPLTIKNIIKSKCFFTVIKSYVICCVLFVFYFIYGYINNCFNYNITIIDIICVLLLIVMQYYLSNFIGNLVWMIGKKARVVIIVIQASIFLIVNFFVNKNHYIEFVCFTIILTIILYALGVILIKYISKETLIERSI